MLSLLCVASLMFAQETEEKVKGAHPYNLEENENVAPEFAHWSLIPHIGFSSFDGDFTSEKSYSAAIPSLGIGAEYNFTPIWTVGAEYMYDMYTVVGIPGSTNADTLLNGHMHKLGGYLAMDLVNLFFPLAKRKIVSLHPYVGGGVGFYKRNKYYMDNYYVDEKTEQEINPTHKRGQTASYINSDGEVGPDRDKGYQTVGFIQAGVNLDFNINRTLAVGIRANYSYFTRDYVDGRGYFKGNYAYASKNNDGLFDITLNMRFKLMAVSQSHVRNIASFDTWEKAPEPVYVHDTVIIHRHDSIIYRESSKQREYFQQQLQRQQRIYYVYFDNNKSDLNREGLITIQQVSDILEEDSAKYVVVIGYCDNTGSNSLNNALGDRRAAVVMSELAEEHGISRDRMYGVGMGKLVGRRSQGSYVPNRRSAIRIVDKKTFERMKQALEEKRANRGEALEQIDENTESVVVNALPQDGQNEGERRIIEEITTEKKTTLAKLARQYYNNTYCWIYIYIANKDKISNPSSLTPGMQLRIPELNADEKNITKEESLALYGTVRQGDK